MLFRPFEPDIEVSGLALPSIVDGFAVLKSIPTRTMVDQGLGHIDEHGDWVLDRRAWYPQGAWLAALEALYVRVGEGALFQIGQKIPANAAFPPWVKDIHSAIRAVNVAYHANHRKRGIPMFDKVSASFQSGIGSYGYQATPGRNEILVECHLPYPSAYARGVLTTMARKFESLATVELLDPSAEAKQSTHFAFQIRW